MPKSVNLKRPTTPGDASVTQPTAKPAKDPLVVYYDAVSIKLERVPKSKTAPPTDYESDMTRMLKKPKK